VCWESVESVYKRERCVAYVFVSCARVDVDFFVGSFWECVGSVFKVCLESVWSMFGVCWEYVWSVLGVCWACVGCAL